MEIPAHIEVVRTEGLRLAEAAQREGLEATIEPCPGWRMRDLVRHLAEIHLWAAGQVSGRADTLSPETEDDISAWWPELPPLYPDDDVLVDYYLETNANLVRELESAPADLDCPTFLAAPSPLAMWARRQAHETSIHRYDAESPGATITTFEPRFAADGIDEILVGFATREDSFPVDVPRTISVHATDTDDHWLVEMSPRGIATTTDSTQGNVALAGSANDLYLALWNRGDDRSIAVSGDAGVLDLWRREYRIRWTRDRAKEDH